MIEERTYPLAGVRPLKTRFNFFDSSKNQVKIIPDFSTITRFSDTII